MSRDSVDPQGDVTHSIEKKSIGVKTRVKIKVTYVSYKLNSFGTGN